MVSSDDEANLSRLHSRMSDTGDKDRWRRELKQKAGQSNATPGVYYDSAGSTNYASGWENWTKKTPIYKPESSAEGWTRKSKLTAIRPESSAEGWNKKSVILPTLPETTAEGWTKKNPVREQSRPESAEEAWNERPSEGSRHNSKTGSPGIAKKTIIK